nr:MAG TPA: hypothetical protein [Caudoviricetes sp.]
MWSSISGLSVGLSLLSCSVKFVSAASSVSLLLYNSG